MVQRNVWNLMIYVFLSSFGFCFRKTKHNDLVLLHNSLFPGLKHLCNPRATRSPGNVSDPESEDPCEAQQSHGVRFLRKHKPKNPSRDLTLDDSKFVSIFPPKRSFPRSDCPKVVFPQFCFFQKLFFHNCLEVFEQPKILTYRQLWPTIHFDHPSILTIVIWPNRQFWPIVNFDYQLSNLTNPQVKIDGWSSSRVGQNWRLTSTVS